MLLYRAWSFYVRFTDTTCLPIGSMSSNKVDQTEFTGLCKSVAFNFSLSPASELNVIASPWSLCLFIYMPAEGRRAKHRTSSTQAQGKHGEHMRPCYFMILHGTLWYFMILYGALSYFMILNIILWHYMILHSTLW